MLISIKKIDDRTVAQLFELYAESMHDLQNQFRSFSEMKQSYAQFLTEFLSHANQLVLVESIGGEWVSGLRAIESSDGCWFLEAVETRPDKRRNGYGHALIQDTIDYLKMAGMQQITCQIAKNNVRSQKLHTACGFIPTQEASIDPWGETDDKSILYKYFLPCSKING